MVCIRSILIKSSRAKLGENSNEYSQKISPLDCCCYTPGLQIIFPLLVIKKNSLTSTFSSQFSNSKISMSKKTFFFFCFLSNSILIGLKFHKISSLIFPLEAIFFFNLCFLDRDFFDFKQKSLSVAFSFSKL